MIFWLFLGVGWVSAGRRLGVGWAAGGGVKTSGCRVCGSLGGPFGFHGRFRGHMGAFLDCSWLLWFYFEIIFSVLVVSLLLRSSVVYHDFNSFFYEKDTMMSSLYRWVAFSLQSMCS